jgi:hypothetical protein
MGFPMFQAGDQCGVWHASVIMPFCRVYSYLINSGHLDHAEARYCKLAAAILWKAERVLTPAALRSSDGAEFDRTSSGSMSSTR